MCTRESGLSRITSVYISERNEFWQKLDRIGRARSFDAIISVIYNTFEDTQRMGTAFVTDRDYLSASSATGVKPRGIISDRSGENYGDPIGVRFA